MLDNAARQTLAKMASFLASQQSPPQSPAAASTAGPAAFTQTAAVAILRGLSAVTEGEPDARRESIEAEPAAVARN